MNEKVYRILEFDKIKESLRQEAVSSMAKKSVDELIPLTEEHEIKDLLTETDEAVSVILHKGTLPLGGLSDVKKHARYAEKGGVLSMGELLGIRSSLVAAAEVTTFLKDEELTGAPKIKSYLEVINPEVKLAEHIGRCIVSEEEMSDAASPALRDIRNKITRQRQSARNRLNAMISSSTNRELLADPVITMRDGRSVLPVKQENRSRFPGIIHDRSSTRATLFIEPQAVVEINNEIRELEIKEKEEIHRILAQLSSEVGVAIRHIINNQKYLTILDVIFAKGKLSVKQGGFAARLSPDGVIDIRRGRHPLIDKDTAVPIDISAGCGYRTLIITGPNTGGKTVTLKTVGLMMLMTQAGLHIPAAEGSMLPVMKKIYADIGDEQSIEQSMSTFSSHMKNIVDIVEKADEKTLVLMDELGAGTDPVEGAALAIAVLEELANRGAMIFATTHYSELKKYALSTEGVENASMEFDIETLSPTYRLITGTPGRSNAFEISKKLGLPRNIIENAQSLLDSDEIEFENVVTAIEADRKTAEAELSALRELSEELEKRRAEIERRERELEAKRIRVMEKARAEAEDMLIEARDFADEVKSELREIEREAAKSGTEARKRQQELSRRIRHKKEQYHESSEQQIPINTKPASRNDIKPGDRVNVVTLGQKGTVASFPDAKDELFVQIGIIKIKVSLSDITKIEESGVQKHFEKTRYGKLYKEKTMNISASINVIGKTLDEAVIEVDKYLDDAYMSGLTEVSIVHGRGTGTLRNGLRDLFSHHPHVKSFESASYYEGGEGATLVKLK